MEPNEFAKRLDDIYHWQLHTDKILEKRGKNYNGIPSAQEPPEAGAYPVVLASRPREKRCEGNRECDYNKTYSRTSTGWKEYCHECRKHFDIHNKETLELIAQYHAERGTIDVK